MLGWILLIAVVVVVAYYGLQYVVLKEAVKRGRTNKARSTADMQRVSITGTREFDVEVVGESHYQRALRQIAGAGEVRRYCAAELVPEDENPHDDKAVAVFIGGEQVGYLSRSDARAFRRRYRGVVGYCEAVIVGGGKGKNSLGVWLDTADAF